MPSKPLSTTYSPGAGMPKRWSLGWGRWRKAKKSSASIWVFGAARCKSEAGDHSLGIDGNEQVESFVPAETVAPADVSLARQPARTPSLGIPGGHSRTIQSFVGAILCLHHIYQMQEEGNDGLVMVAQQPIKLAPIGQGGKGSKQSMFSVAVETSLTPKAAPLAEDGEGNHLTTGQGGVGPFFRGAFRLEESSTIT